jgi:hypothetical protein
VPDFMASALRDNAAEGELPIGDINNWIIDGNTFYFYFYFYFCLLKKINPTFLGWGLSAIHSTTLIKTYS